MEAARVFGKAKMSRFFAVREGYFLNGRSYAPGEAVELPADLAAELVRGGHLREADDGDVDAVLVLAVEDASDVETATDKPRTASPRGRSRNSR